MHELRAISDIDLTLRTIALALDAHGLNVVQQAVKQGRGQDGIVIEDGGPLLVNPVGGDQGGPAFIAVAEDLKQAVRPELVDGQVAQFVNAQNLRFDVVIERTFDAAAGMSLCQRVDDLNGAAEQHRMSSLARGMAQRRHQMALAQAGAGDEHDIGVLFDKVQMKEVLDEQAVDLGRPVPVKLIKCVFRRS